jgi:nicotinate-nucleotide pyrophosphorylase (carboxylating)
MDDRELSELLEDMLREDVGSGDITSSFTPNKPVKAVITVNGSGFISGVHEVNLLFRKHNIKVKSYVKEGYRVRYRQQVFTLEGKARDILSVERTALNLLSRMSGITTLTRKYVDALKKAGSKCRVVATRKTTPGLRYFEKKAVILGGGLPHRRGLYDMILIKDNHLKLFNNDIERALDAACKSRIKSKIEIEVSSVKDALIAARGKPDMIMFDNMKSRQVRGAVEELKKAGLRKHILLEVSGGITLRNIRYYAKTGVDWISVGRLTSSAPALDYRLDII